MGGFVNYEKLANSKIAHLNVEKYVSNFISI